MRKLLFLSLLASMTATAQPSTTGSSFDSLFTRIFPADQPGGAVLIVQNGSGIYGKGFGLADIKTKEAISTKTLFNLGSISKTFVAYGILNLVKEGKLSLDDPIIRYFPDFKNKEIAGKVKIVHLLTHTSGLPDSRPVDEQKAFYITAKDEENFAPIKLADTLEFEPGTHYHYSNPAFNGLALIIEKISGMKWQQYIRQLIFSPAGMERSTITDGPYPETGVSHGYVLNDQQVWEELDYGEEPTFAAAGNGGVWSSVDELWKYEQAIQEHIFLPADWITRSRTIYPFPAWKGEEPSRLGLSWFLTSFEDQQLIGHTGSQGGFRSDYVWVPEKKLFYVVLCNTPKDLMEVRTLVFSILKKQGIL